MDYPFKEQNRKAKAKCEESYGKPMADCDQRQIGSDFRMFDGSCAHCGKYVTAQNLSYFGFDVEVVLCYDCQKLNK